MRDPKQIAGEIIDRWLATVAPGAPRGSDEPLMEELIAAAISSERADAYADHVAAERQINEARAAMVTARRDAEEARCRHDRMVVEFGEYRDRIEAPSTDGILATVEHAGAHHRHVLRIVAAPDGETYVEVSEPPKCECVKRIPLSQAIHVLLNLSDDERIAAEVRDCDDAGHAHDPAARHADQPCCTQNGQCGGRCCGHVAGDPACTHPPPLPHDILAALRDPSVRLPGESATEHVLFQQLHAARAENADLRGRLALHTLDVTPFLYPDTAPATTVSATPADVPANYAASAVPVGYESVVDAIAKPVAAVLLKGSAS